MIKVVDLKKSFHTQAGRLDVLKSVNLSIKDGEMVGIVGASGVGKSTLLHILGSLDRPTSGKVCYEGKDIFSMDDDSLASFRNSSIGFVFQFHHLLPEFTAIENVMMPGLINIGSNARMGRRLNYEEVAAKAESLLKDLELYKRKDHRPGKLSGGEQQRVAVARALILEPKVVLADEPTGNLDTHTGAELFNLLLKINREKSTTFVIVTHNDSLAKQCHRVLEMVDGKL